jgi:hypothetical protein
MSIELRHKPAQMACSEKKNKRGREMVASGAKGPDGESC